MAIWLPLIEAGKVPRYVGIANAIVRDVRSGALLAGMRLPPHRELAYRLGVTPGTIGRAYAEAERRGLVSGEVGRGTFVCREIDGESPSDLVVPDHPSPSVIDLGLNLSAVGESEPLLRATLSELTQQNDLAALLEYQPAGGMKAHRAAGASWIGRSGIRADADRIIVCNGAQHGLMIALMSVTQPGDLVVTEAVTYPGMKALGQQLNLQLHGLTMDREGLRPDTFEEICRMRAPKVLYCMPVLQNPTTVSMSEESLRRVVAIAQQYGVFIIEDDVYGFLADRRSTPMADIAPASTIYVSSASKSIAPGLRVGYLAVPQTLVDTVSGVARMTDWMTAPLMAEIARRWIEDGSADGLVRWHREQARARQEVAQRLLSAHVGDSQPQSYHLWLPLPEQWRMDAFAAEALRRGVRVITGDAFSVRRDASPHAVRLCLGGAHAVREIDQALRTLVEILSARPRALLNLH